MYIYSTNVLVDTIDYQRYSLFHINITSTVSYTKTIITIIIVTY
jgi:hypothetical protein